MFISHCGLHIPVPEALQILVLQRDLPDSGRNAGTGMERFQCGAHVVRTGGPEGRLKIELSVGERAGIRTQDLLIKSQVSAVSLEWTLMAHHSKTSHFQ
jgi:hypothetical protein